MLHGQNNLINTFSDLGLLELKGTNHIFLEERIEKYILAANSNTRLRFSQFLSVGRGSTE
jgi:hypothetical protein